MNTPSLMWNENIDIDATEDSLKSPCTFGSMDRFSTSEDVLNNVVREEKLIRVKESICRWAYECDIPFHVFEKDSFKMLLEAIGQLGPSVQPPTRDEFEDTFLGKEVERTKNLFKRYEEEWKLDGCSIIVDTWSDKNKRRIMNVCVNSKLGTVFLSSKESLNKTHTGEYIFEYVDSCIEEVGPTNVVQIVTDNAFNNMEAVKLLKAKRPTIFWTSCAAHTINLILEGICGLPKYKEILDQAKKLIVFIYAHRKTLTLMRRFTKKRDIVRTGVTRFASIFLTFQSLAIKKSQLRLMFSSDDWEKCKFSKTIKGESAYETVTSSSFWADVTLCLKVFAPLVKVLRMVDAAKKPSMSFVYGELKKAKQEIIDVLSNNEKEYEPILDIISTKIKDRLDTCLHLTAYLLNPFYLYNNPEVRDNIDANDAVVNVVGTLFPGDYEMQNQILMVELLIYKGKLGKFNRVVAIKGCEVNNEKFDPAYWWEIYGFSAPNLRKIAIRILSLNTSSSGCKTQWSTFEGRKRLETNKLNNLAFVQFNANLMEKYKKRKARGYEVLLANDASEAQDWIVEGSDVDDYLKPRTRARYRELDDEFESESEEEVNENVEYKSNQVQIIEQYKKGKDEALI